MCQAEPAPLYSAALRSALLLLADVDPDVRREALIAFNSCAYNRPTLLLDSLAGECW